MPSISARIHDIAVVGGGIVGLWTAFEAARQGRNVLLLDKRRIGAGASGGLLGALMPHQPTGWNDKKQFQLDGLLSLEYELAALEEVTGKKTGYRRCGRIMPIRHAEKRRQSGDWAFASHETWPDPYRWFIADETLYPEWLPKAAMPYGANADTLSARVNPRDLVDAVRTGAERSGVTIMEGAEIRFDGSGRASLADGTRMEAGRVILAGGWETFGMVDAGFVEPTGSGVKGQAALLRPAKPVDSAQPIIYDDGTYVIAHDSGHVAVGSTSENTFGAPFETDAALDTLVDHARALCPALADAEIVERWAGVRPKAAGREPLVGALPGFPGTLIATGGFKISFAIAHLMAKAVLAQADGQRPGSLPDAFLPENRLKPRPGRAP